tara:strand:- start:217 stop:456 length:240 start_codon:yes stop_codon:yes gene_type:complete
MTITVLKNYKLVEIMQDRSKEIVQAYKIGKLRSSQAFNELCSLSIENFKYLDNGKLTRDEFSYLDNILCHNRITVREEV